MTEPNKVEEELFCLKYELNALADIILRNSSERWVPGFIHERTEFSHLDRYELACKYTIDKKVADVACGAGKGSNLISTNGLAKEVVGFDIQADAIRYAKCRYSNKNIDFLICDATNLGITEQFDMAISFETIEHIPDYKSFLASISKALKKDGYLLISTPISSLEIDNKPENPHHLQEWGFNKFHAIINVEFTIEKTFVQLYPKIAVNTYKKSSLVERLLRKLKSLIPITRVEKKIEIQEINQTNFSRIEEYVNQYPIEELGSSRIGYQIVLAKVKK